MRGASLGSFVVGPCARLYERVLACNVTNLLAFACSQLFRLWLACVWPSRASGVVSACVVVDGVVAARGQTWRAGSVRGRSRPSRAGAGVGFPHLAYTVGIFWPGTRVLLAATSGRRTGRNTLRCRGVATTARTCSRAHHELRGVGPRCALQRSTPRPEVSHASSHVLRADAR